MNKIYVFSFLLVVILVPSFGYESRLSEYVGNYVYNGASGVIIKNESLFVEDEFSNPNDPYIKMDLTYNAKKDIFEFKDGKILFFSINNYLDIFIERAGKITTLNTHKNDSQVSKVLHPVIVSRVSGFFSESTKKGVVNYNPQIGNSLFDLFNIQWVFNDKTNWIDFSLSKNEDIKIDKLVIMNGFVSFYGRDFFALNGRAKKIIISIASENIMGTLEDKYGYQIINFNHQVIVKKDQVIRLSVQDIYKGRKYSESAISAILFEN